MDLKQKVSGHFRRTCKDQLVLQVFQEMLVLMAKREAMERLRQQRRSRVPLGQQVLQVHLVLREQLGQRVRMVMLARRGQRVQADPAALVQPVRLVQMEVPD
jgi:hypothetical protein